jgi:hypothetical protein
LQDLQSPTLGFQYAVPADWVVFDYSHVSDPTQAQPFVIASAIRSDNNLAAVAAGADIHALQPQGTVVVLAHVAMAQPSDTPQSVLTSGIAQLVAQPPGGATASVARSPRALPLGKTRGSDAVLTLSWSGTDYELEEAYLASPHAGELIRVDAIAPAAGWNGTLADQILSSIKLF